MLDQHVEWLARPPGRPLASKPIAYQPSEPQLAAYSQLIDGAHQDKA